MCAGNVPGPKQVPVHESRLGVPTLGSGGRIEQPPLKFDMRRFGSSRIDTECLPELRDRAPIAGVQIPY